MRTAIERLEKLIVTLSRWCYWVAGIGLVAMLALIIADIFGNKIFSSPIPGAIELVGFLGVVVTAFAIAYTYVLGGHIQVDFVVFKLPARLRNISLSLMHLLGITLFVVLAWRSYEFGWVVQSSGEVSMTQGIPFYPFIYALAFCSLVTALVLLMEFIKSVLSVVHK